MKYVDGPPIYKLLIDRGQGMVCIYNPIEIKEWNFYIIKNIFKETTHSTLITFLSLERHYKN